jgi:hypothetical protein
MVELVRAGLATAGSERVPGAEVLRLQITAEGRKQIGA